MVYTKKFKCVMSCALDGDVNTCICDSDVADTISNIQPRCYSWTKLYYNF